jgi:hypothetical protein
MDPSLKGEKLTLPKVELFISDTAIVVNSLGYAPHLAAENADERLELIQFGGGVFELYKGGNFNFTCRR